MTDRSLWEEIQLEVGRWVDALVWTGLLFLLTGKTMSMVVDKKVGIGGAAVGLGVLMAWWTLLLLWRPYYRVIRWVLVKIGRNPPEDPQLERGGRDE